MKLFTHIPVFFCVYAYVLNVCSGQYDTKGMSEKSAKTCTKTPFIGVCHPVGEAWYYDARDNSCKMLQRGVCAGGNNLFPTIKKCTKSCIPLTPKTSKICLEPPVVGPCGPIKVSWYFDPKTMYCKMFNHTICGGGGNSFLSELKCQSVCLPNQTPQAHCSKPPKPGRCLIANKRYYFDERRNACLQFPNKKCGSNRNGFAKWEKCMQRCSYINQKGNELPYGGVPGYVPHPGPLGPPGQHGYPSASGQPGQPALPGQVGSPGQPAVTGPSGNAIPMGLPPPPGQPGQQGPFLPPGQNLTPAKINGPLVPGQTVKPNIPH
ncbi:papilin-like [Dermacentor silvarum]|uniref:papilin-like n=1 Tax=Dermacentor silvarum TaxID=543639 RepID=UPI00189776D4|nr:papilin-like [Dermacentor silvarum]